MKKLIFIAAILSFLSTAGAQNGRKPAAFKTLTSRSSFPLDCHFAASGFNGRIRFSGMGEVHFLVEDAKKSTYECELQVEQVSQKTAAVVAASSLHFGNPLNCRPAIPTETAKQITDRLELVFSKRGIKFWVEANEDAPECVTIHYQREEMARIFKQFIKKTGSGQGAEKNF